MKTKKINWTIFLPPFLLLAGAVIFNILDSDSFTKTMVSAYYWILKYFGWLFQSGPLVMFAVCMWIYFSRFGNVVIGGVNAKPLFNKKTWFAVTLCTTVAAGIVFWAAAEPMQHFLNPPASGGIAPGSWQAAVFSMEVIFNNWTLLPYSIYTITTVMFAFGFYNMKKSFSLGSCISPLVPEKYEKPINTLIDIICVFALVAGMAASLGVGVLNISGGIRKLFNIEGSSTVYLWIIVAVVGTFTLSAILGIMKGIKRLSDFNIYVYFAIIALVLIFGGTLFILNFGLESIAAYISDFFKLSLFTGAAAADSWSLDWPVFYFGNWAAWAPISAVFLGRISRGRKVKEVIAINLIVTSLFSVVWFVSISGATLNLAMHNPSAGMAEAYAIGYESVIYQLFENMPLTFITIPLFVISVFISFVTASDSCTVAISGLCSHGISEESPEAHWVIKFIWAIVIAAVAYVMMGVGSGITGMKMLSNIGGLPAIIFITFITYAAVKVTLSPEKYDKTQQ